MQVMGWMTGTGRIGPPPQALFQSLARRFAVARAWAVV